MKHERTFNVELRGRRKAADILGRTIRDHLLRLAASRYCVGMSDRQAASYLRTKLGRYAAGAWRRDRVEDRLPDRHLGRIEATLWELLRIRDHVPSDKTIRNALAHDFRLPTA
jgi:hypothetical protein